MACIALVAPVAGVMRHEEIAERNEDRNSRLINLRNQKHRVGFLGTIALLIV